MKKSPFKNLIAAIVAVILSASVFSQEVLNISIQQKRGASQEQTAASKNMADDNVLIISGKILNANTQQAIGKTRINLDKFGDELLQASVDMDGNYAIALKKNELGEPIRITFKVPGYKKFVVKNISKNQSFVDVNILLEPETLTNKSTNEVQFQNNNDPFNPMVLRFNQ